MELHLGLQLNVSTPAFPSPCGLRTLGLNTLEVVVRVPRYI